MNVSVVIPTYNGKKYLEEYIPFLNAALKAYGHRYEIILVENGSSDGSVNFIKENHPHIRLIENETNEGFGPAVNKGVRKARHSIVILLNNDIKVEKSFIEPLTRHFIDGSVFAVVSRSIVDLGKEKVNESVTVPGFSDGFLSSEQPLVHDPSIKIEKACTNLHASGGFAAFSREKFLELGGFDDIYHPFYYEDVDLSYQAWKRGWKVLYDPKSVVYHRSHGTTRKVATDNFINEIEQRNKFLLTWKNVSDLRLLLRHCKRLLRLALFPMWRDKKREFFILKCFFLALPRFPAVLRYRLKNGKKEKLSDNRIFCDARNQDTKGLLFERFLTNKVFGRKKGFNILLIDPPGFQKGLNVGLAYLAGALKENNFQNVDVLDLNNVFQELSEQNLTRLLENSKYDVIGYSIKTPTYTPSQKYFKLTKNLFPKAVHVAGGAHVTLNFEEFLTENKHFHYAFVGEGEETFVEFCQKIRAGEKPEIPGVADRQNMKTLKKNSFIARLDTLPYPDFDAFKGFDFSNFEYPLVTSRGCPYKCTYCSVGLISGRKMRFREVTRVIDELTWAKEKLQIKRFNVIDDNFTLDVKRAKLFCDTLIDQNLNLTWACGNGIRADRVDPRLAERMRKAGCHLVCVGVENADPKIFNAIKKGETLEDVVRGINVLKEAGIEVIGFFIIGLPGDNKKSSEMAYEFVKTSRLDSARFGILLPYPKTEVYDWIVDNGKFLKDYKEGIHFSDKLSPVFETDTFSAKEMLQTYERLFTKLRYFTFLVPKDTTELDQIKRTLTLVWKYDKSFVGELFINIIKKNLRPQ